MGRFNERLVDAGVIQAADGLHPAAKGARVKFSKDNKRTVVDGPFTETRAWSPQAGSNSLARRGDRVGEMPGPHPGDEAEIEVRQIFEAEFRRVRARKRARKSASAQGWGKIVSARNIPREYARKCSSIENRLLD
jgi:hypothetical protein